MTTPRVTVPVEPTEAMWKVAREVWDGHEKPYTFACTKDAFRAMLLSAPVAPVWVGIDVAEDAPAEFKMFAAEFNRLRSAREDLATVREEGGAVETAVKIATDMHHAYEQLIYGLPKYLEAENLTDEENMIREAWITLDVTAHRRAALASSGDQLSGNPGQLKSGDHAELARLAEAATPGPWSAVDWDDDFGENRFTVQATEPEKLSPGQSSIWPDGIRCLRVAETMEGERPAEDAAFIAAANPVAVLALLAENAELKYAVQNGNEHLEFWETRATEAERKLAEAVGLLTGLAAIFRGNPRMSSLVAWWNRSKQPIYALSSKEAERG